MLIFKNKLLSLIYFLLFILSHINCAINNTKSNDPISTSNTGSLTIYFESTNYPFNENLPSILPDVDLIIDSYRITLTGPNNQQKVINTDNNENLTIEYLTEGSWMIKVSAVNSTDQIIGEGNDIVTITNNQITDCTISITPLKDNGSLNLTIIWDTAEIPSATIIGKLEASGKSPIEFILNNSNNIYENDNIPPGNYILYITLYNDEGLGCGFTTYTVHIITDYITTATIPITTIIGGYEKAYHVSQTGSNSNTGTESSPWRTLQYAADIMEPGDVVIVHPGNYNRVTISKSGTALSNISFIGKNLPDTQTSINNTIIRGFNINATNIRIENFDVTDIGSTERGGININDSENIMIIRNYFHELNCSYRNGGAIRGSGNNIILKNNILWKVEGTSLSIIGNDWIVEGNDISHGTDLNQEGTKVSTDADAVRFFGSGHIIRANYIHDFLREEGSQGTSAPHMDAFQTFAENEGQYADNIIIEGNIVDNIGAQIVMMEDNDTINYVHHITFRNNIFLNSNGSTAVNIHSCENLIFVNNIIAYSSRGLRLRDGCRDSIVLNNIFYNNSNQVALFHSENEDSKPGTVWDYNMYYPSVDFPSEYEFDRNSLNGIDPMFIASLENDFHLTQDSQAIDNGTTVSGFHNDIDNHLRPYGNGWDIGPYEYNSSTLSE